MASFLTAFGLLATCLAVACIVASRILAGSPPHDGGELHPHDGAPAHGR